MTVLFQFPEPDTAISDGRSFVERYTRQMAAEYYRRQCEDYAKLRPAAGQKSLVANSRPSHEPWKETLHPRGGGGKFTDKTGGSGDQPDERQKDLFETLTAQLTEQYQRTHGGKGG